MGRLKIMMDQNNYVGMDNTHIFVNFNRDNLNYLTGLHPDSVQKVHIFISNHNAINENLRLFLQQFDGCYPNSKKKRTKIIIHIPAKMKQLYYLLKDYLDDTKNYQAFKEKRSSWFRYHTHDRKSYDNTYCISVIQCADGIKLDIHPPGMNSIDPIIKFPAFYYDSNLLQEEKRSIFDTAEERLNPFDFKDKLIEAFKRDCPSGILKSFKSDDEIFDYITQQGEWSNIKERKNDTY